MTVRSDSGQARLKGDMLRGAVARDGAWQRHADIVAALVGLKIGNELPS